MEYEEMDYPEFNEQQMLRFAKKERIIDIMFKDLSKRNPKMSQANVLEVVFNSEVLEDSIMTEEYDKCK